MWAPDIQIGIMVHQRQSFASGRPVQSGAGLTRFSHRLTAEARDRPAMTSLRLLAVLTVLSSMPPRVKRRAPRPDGPLTHFASPRGEKSGLTVKYEANHG